VDLYISGDVEADGPVPGTYSMLSIGLAVAGSYDGGEFRRHDPATETFYAELKPISDEFVPEALAKSGLDRDLLRATGQPPRDAMEDAAAWVRTVAGDRRPVFAGYPVVFDWMFVYWYFVRFTEAGSPFGHSSALDIKTMYATKARVPVTRATKRHMPAGLLSQRPHTHHALEDAIEQADLLANLFVWHPGPSARHARRPR
jgi:hypothetical protein